jgi:S-formylglutathione hydrolase
MGMMRAAACVVVAASSLLACGSSDDTTSSSPADTAVATTTGDSSTSASPTLEARTIGAPSLDGNLLGDPSEVDVVVAVPGSYGTDPDRRYPVVYFLAGYDEDASIAPVAHELEALVAAGAAPEMILVGVSGDNSLGGGFYVDSPVSGNWASAIVDDVVPAIDREYRTLADARSRGVAGFSMGGFGAISLAMGHPDVFGAVYALSAGLLAPDGLATTQMFDDPAVIADVVAARAALASMPPGEVSDRLVAELGRSGDARFSAAYGMAFAPDPTGPPPWFRYPYETPDGAADPEIWATWHSGYGGPAEEVESHHDELDSLAGIVIDVGTSDPYAWIPPGSEHFHDVLESTGIDHRIERHPGGHGPVAPRAHDVMLPFFAEVLAAS